MNLAQHLKEIDEWVEEARLDHPDVGDIDLYGDIVPSYIAAHVDGGESSPMGKAIRQAHGRELDDDS